MSSNAMEVAALGRPFTLGMLYHALQDKLIPGVTLWDEKTLKEHTVESSQHNSAFEVITSDSIEDKSSLLDVEASLKASFLSGLIEIGGSAKYLNDKKKFHHQSRVTLQYKATISFKQLSMAHIGTMDTKHTEAIETGLATHVVTGILYGANAFFVFDSEKSDASNIQNIDGSVQAAIKKIPSFNIEGRVDIKLNEEEKALTDTLSCKFYGDFLLESIPSTFETAVTTYINLPKLLVKTENAVPLKVWLMPLKYFDFKLSQTMVEISVRSIRMLENALEDLNLLEKRCNDLLVHKVVKHFPVIHKKLSCFQKLCTYNATTLQQTFAKKLLLVRAIEEDDSKLETIFEDREKSPFHHDKLTKWMDDKEREINVISSCVDIMEGTKIVPNQSELDSEVLASGVDALCFVFTSLETAEPYLKELADYMDPLKLQGAVGGTTHDHWYSSDEVLTNMQEKAKVFHDLAKALKNSTRFRFLEAAIANEKYKGATIYHYKEGVLITDDFSKPAFPPVQTITDKSALIWYACALTLDPDTAHRHLILSEGDKKATHHTAPLSYPDLPQRFDHFVQVLCREGLTGRCYWEVEWSAGYSEDIAVGVAYKGIFRKGKGDWCKLGWNVMSWCLGHRWSPPEATLYAKHNNKCDNFPLPSTGCNRLGVYLDWPGGSLSYYKVSSNTLSHIHTFYTAFTEPVYPAFLIWRNSNYVFLRL